MTNSQRNLKVEGFLLGTVQPEKECAMVKDVSVGLSEFIETHFGNRVEAWLNNLSNQGAIDDESLLKEVARNSVEDDALILANFLKRQNIVSRRSDPRGVCLMTAHLLKAMGKKAHLAIPAMGEALERSESGDVSECLVEALKSFGKKAEPALNGLVHQVLRYDNEDAAMLIRRIGEKGVSLLLQKLESSISGYPESWAEKEHPLFMKMCGHNLAISFLGNCREQTTKVAAVLIRLLKIEELSEEACRALTNLGPVVLDELYQVIHSHSQIDTRRAAISCLPRVACWEDWDKTRCVEELQHAFKSKDTQILVNAVVALCQIGEKDETVIAIDRLQSELDKCQNDDCKVRIMKALGEIGPAANNLTPTLVEIFKTKGSVEVWQSAAISLWRINPEEAYANIAACVSRLKISKWQDAALDVLLHYGQLGIALLAQDQRISSKAWNLLEETKTTNPELATRTFKAVSHRNLLT